MKKINYQVHFHGNDEKVQITEKTSEKCYLSTLRDINFPCSVPSFALTLLQRPAHQQAGDIHSYQ